MATYNRSNFILESLNSIQNQTFTNWECIIVDDGGTDNTKEVIAPIQKKDDRFSFLKRPDNYLKGLPGSRNFGLDLATGDYIIFFDDDDVVHPQNLELCVKELVNNNVSFCRYLRSVFVGVFDYKFDFSTNYKSFNININDLDKVLKNELPFNSCAVMWKKECFAENKFIETLMYAEEWELYSRILSNGFKGISIEKHLFFGRKHPKSNTGEFYENDEIRVNSYKTALRIVSKNLVAKNLLSYDLLKYFTGLAISFRDFSLLLKLLEIASPQTQTSLLIKLKYQIFPLWKVYNKIKKRMVKL